MISELDKSKDARLIEEVNFLVVVAETAIALVFKATEKKSAVNLDGGPTFFRPSVP